ncbi:hypothetical protein Glove_256g32 [Diversispora epigaea]|uniref:Uncharacterized protein n=1 Tax=Diversispora epigaea TaxID=1348612 RepID=A0A397IEX5_9GLOM|nr:hypothetical protein Glove_256g32 [Diversispora epigaea]
MPERHQMELNETTVNSKGSRGDDDYTFEEDISLSIQRNIKNRKIKTPPNILQKQHF